MTLRVHGAASLQGVPWELLIKDFRHTLEDQAFERLSEYPRALFDFLAAHKQLFPDAEREETFVGNAIQEMLAAQRIVRDSEKYKRAKAEEATTILAAGIAALVETLKGEQPHEPVTTQDVDAAIARYREAVRAEIKKAWVPIVEEFGPIADTLSELAIRELMNHYDRYLANTGIVIGGYGTHDYYPAFELHNCFGFLADRFIAVQSRSKSIERGSLGVIEGFAQDNMIDTFRFGIGFDAYAHVHWDLGER